MMNYNLHNLLYPWIKNAPNINIKNIVSDSRIAMYGDLFIAIPGEKKDGRNYILQAIKQNVSAVISETTKTKKHGEIEIFKNTPIIYLSSLHKNISKIAGRFYDNPSNSLNLIGITGTNGKTTISHLTSQWTTILGKKSAVMGTIGNGIINHHIYQTKNTTDSAIYIQKFLSKLKKLGINFVSLEVSSHSLSQYRIEHLKFSAAIFTNLSYEHIDYHNNMKNYELTKWKLFSKIKVKKYIINANDKIGKKWLLNLQSITNPKNIVAVSSNYIPNFFPYWKGQWIYASKIYYNSKNTYINFKSNWGNEIIHSPLIGKHNVNNILLTISTLLTLGYPLKKLIQTSKKLKQIIGRMEIFQTTKKPKIIIDYAHNPKALQQALITAKHHCYGKLWCIFGCGGNRDKNKRHIMGKISEKYSDMIIITNDNPREENQKKIIDEIKKGIKNKKIQIIYNRTKAIQTAIEKASQKDLILIIGKGHEIYQIFNKKYYMYSDRITIQKLLGLKYNDTMQSPYYI
ncbi:MAG: UDP-N-acetylmuramoyl-L-alanyl-D-glutamate--2, 6-diaminopimelate ligase [Candidatus Westeberhardia cardiocondylae]|nr:UDP-N-acetylmuramoyl-L-alanyl-D-glutamate--2, 6-diaminopimelate ligase [Candidatus Westeberhardia cardiocondylae]